MSYLICVCIIYQSMALSESYAGHTIGHSPVPLYRVNQSINKQSVLNPCKRQRVTKLSKTNQHIAPLYKWINEIIVGWWRQRLKTCGSEMSVRWWMTPHNSQTTRYSFPGHCNMYSSLYLICASLTCKQIYAWNGGELYTLLAFYKIAVQKLHCSTAVWATLHEYSNWGSKCTC